MSLLQPRIGMIEEQRSIASSWPHTVAAMARFAEGFGERRAPGRMIASQADLALAYSPAAEINYFYGDPQLRFAPSITVDRQSGFAQSARMLSDDGQRGERFGEREARALFDRLLTRQTRVSSLPSFVAAKAQTRSLPEMHADHVARVLPKTTIAAPEISEEGGRAARRDAVEKGWGTPLALPVEARPVVLAAPEVRRVAEQVMQQIQDRVIAQRERVGRR
jgi:hypothetical protein